MASSKAGPAAMPAMDPRAHVSWDPKGKVRLSGDLVRPGDRVRLTLEGKCTSCSMDEYGHSIGLEPNVIRVEPAGGANEDDGEPMTNAVTKLGSLRSRRQED